MAKKPATPILTDPYARVAKLIRVIDGDTIEVQIDLGFSIYHKITLRLARVNATEMKDGGVNWKTFVEKWFTGVPTVIVKTTKDRTDRYKRYLAEVYDGPRSLVDDLLAAGAATYRSKK